MNAHPVPHRTHDLARVPEPPPAYLRRTCDQYAGGPRSVGTRAARLDANRMENRNEQRLVLRAQEGCPEAFDQLLTCYERPLYRHARRMLGSDDEAYDALQQTYMVIVRSIRQLRGREHFRAWAYGVATRTCLKRLERRRRNQGAELDDALAADGAPSPEMLVAAQQQREALLEQVLILSPPLRSVILLHFYEGLSLPELAAALEIPLGTAKSRLGAGLQKLRVIEEVKNHVG